MPQMRDLKTELFKVVCLDSNNRIIDISDAACGTVNRAIPIVREVIHSALQKFAVSIICAHNHPSGDPKPSKEDRDFTRELCQAGNIMQVKILDHLIIGDNQYHSFADSGELVTYK
jgi:DNA repair protein RadC